MALTGEDVLTDLASVKTELGITSSTYDAELEDLIRAASKAIETFCRRPLARATVTDERHRAIGGVELYLKRRPVVSVTSITLDGTTVEADNFALADADSGLVYFYTPLVVQAPRRRGVVQDYALRYAEPDYKATYVGGWVTRQQATDAVGTRDLPYDIERACIRLVSYFWGTKGAVGEIAAEKIGDASVSYANSSSSLPTHVTTLLTRYRDPGIL